ncbi:helix-turn-helix domain-containing protein, partial [Mitsuaria sp. CC2]|uniref:helix-turn-helix domain-containing protein n=1 Tax=Mitsuaria sp. CC2 TaxID=3029186 RepID=UPI003B8CA997
KVVRKYQAGGLGCAALAKLFGVDVTVVRSWVGHYRVHGLDGVRKKRQDYFSAAFKLKVLREAKRQDLSNRQAAVLFDLRGGGSVVCKWRRQYDEGGAQALHPKPRGRPPMKPPKPKAAPAAPAKSEDQRTLEELREENELLRTEVAYLKKLDALVRAKPPAAPKGRKPSSS